MFLRTEGWVKIIVCGKWQHARDAVKESLTQNTMGLKPVDYLPK